MENNICGKMYEAVTAMCTFVAQENIKGVQNLIGEVKRYFPIFANQLSSDVILCDADETNLRELRDWITNFEEVEKPRLKNIPEWLDDKAYKDCLSLLSMVKETIKGYFVPPTFEPQQLEQTYKLLFANRLAIAEVMGLSADSFANNLERWLRQNEASQSDKVKEFRDKYAEYVPNVDDFIKKLRTIKGKVLKHKYDEWFAKSDISFKGFFADCQKIVPERNNEIGWNYDAIRKH